MLEESKSVENFEFIGGRLCLDFINTLSDRSRTTPVEVLATYADLLNWSRLAHVLGEEQISSLQDKMEQQPALATRWLVDIKEARMVLSHILDNLVRGQAAPPAALRQFNHLLSETMIHLNLVPAENGFAWCWQSAEDLHQLPLWCIVRDAADLLTSPDLPFVRVCASDDCDWLFLDTSKNHSRRWCDMQGCGNRAKARRHYERQKHLSA